MRKPLKVLYDCDQCPSWCCTYPNIVVNPSDMARLAKHFGITEKQAAKKYTRHSKDWDQKIMRHKKDPLFGSACQFLDLKTRMCQIYHARPRDCRSYPGTERCGYYDFLQDERNRHRDEGAVATTDHRVLDWKPPKK